MPLAQWSFLTNHARVLVCIAHDPGVRLRDIARTLGITERSAYSIVTDLTEAGYRRFAGQIDERTDDWGRFGRSFPLPVAGRWCPSPVFACCRSEYRADLAVIQATGIGWTTEPPTFISIDLTLNISETRSTGPKSATARRCASASSNPHRR
jgi:hypothetical protein